MLSARTLTFQLPFSSIGIRFMFTLEREFNQYKKTKTAKNVNNSAKRFLDLHTPRKGIQGVHTGATSSPMELTYR